MLGDRRRRTALVSMMISIAFAGCLTTQRQKVEQSRQHAASQVEQIDAARDRIAKMDQERQGLRTQIADLESQLKKRDDVQELMQTRLANAKREGERLQAELSSAVLSNSGVKTVSDTKAA